MILDKLYPLYFMIAFSLGIFFCYLTNPKPTIVYKFPSPTNAGKVVYKDKNEQCYSYRATKEECPKDKSIIKAQPIIEDFKQKMKH